MEQQHQRLSILLPHYGGVLHYTEKKVPSELLEKNKIEQVGNYFGMKQDNMLLIPMKLYNQPPEFGVCKDLSELLLDEILRGK